MGREQLDEENGLKEDILRQLQKALGKSDMWRSKYEQEGLAKAEELEMTKMKLQARLSEAQGTIEQLNANLTRPRLKFKQILMKWLLKLTKLTFLIAQWRRRPNNLTVLLGNGNKRLIACQWIWILHKRNAEMLPQNSSESSLPMKNLFSNWMRSERKTRL